MARKIDKNEELYIVKEEELALPPDLDKRETRRKNRNKISFFSFPLFKESIKSNWLGWTITSVGNAILLIIVVMIMSTLNINGTKDSLTDMFSNADTEQTIKMGAISYYSGFSQASETYLTVESAENGIKENLNTAYAEVNNSTTLNMLKRVEGLYDTNYNILKDPKSAKSTTLVTSDTLINNSSLNDTQKTIAKAILPYYIDTYVSTKTDGTSTQRSRLITTVGDYSIILLNEQAMIDESSIDEIKNEVVNTLTLYSSKQDSLSNDSDKEALRKTMAQEEVFVLVPLAAQESIKEETTGIINDLKKSYENDKDAYINNTNNYYSESLKNSVIDVITSKITDIAVYQFLPEYTVDYITNLRGYPISYVSIPGEFDDKGNPKVKEIEITQYNPDKYVLVKSGMGTKSNILEKKHKKVITGVDYTEEEFLKAREDAKENIDMIVDELNSYMNEFIIRDTNNKNKYFDGTELIDENISDRAIELIEKFAEKTLIDDYNKKHDDEITSIDEITSKDGAMSGAQMMSLVDVYANSGIASYKSQYKKLSSKYDLLEANLISLNEATKTVMSQLPTKVNDSLVEMGELNTYGIFIGVVAFGMACVLIPLVYTIILANSLVADKVETGSLAFTLSTPTKRSTFVITEAIYLLLSSIGTGLILYLGGIAARGVGIAMGGTDLVESLPMDQITLYSIGSTCVIVAISGICFFTSCLFNKSRKSISAGGGINIFFFICSILGLFGTKAIPGTVRIEAMDFFNKLTIMSLNDGMAVMNGDVIYWYKLIGLLAIALVTYVAGIIVFDHKDLPL